MSVYSTDPFSVVEKSIQSALYGYAPLASLIRKDNRISFVDGETEPLKENPEAADMPELIVYASGGTFNTSGAGSSSSSECITQQYTVGIPTFEQRANYAAGGINVIKWRLFQAIARVQRGINGLGVQSDAILGLPFVRSCKLLSFSDTMGVDPFPSVQGQRVIMGWTCIALMEVGMVFDLMEATS